MKRLALLFMSSVCLFAACNEEYDPIGSNKPSPVLLVSPLELSFDGAGGTASSKISTNAQEIILGDLPEWVESAVVSDDLSSVTVAVKKNTSDVDARRGTIKMVCSSGDNTATQYLKVFQAGEGSRMFFESFTGRNLPSGWLAQDPASVAAGNGYLALKASGNPGYIYTAPGEFTLNRPYYFSVDMKMNGGEGGVKFYLTDNPLDVMEIYFAWNSNTRRGGIWVRNGATWCAMDDGNIGGGGSANQFEAVISTPEEGEMDDWWRFEVYTSKTAPSSPVVSVAFLRTFNGEVQRLGAGYSRKFNIPAPASGKIALWSRNRECQYKNLVFSYM